MAACSHSSVFAQQTWLIGNRRSRACVSTYNVCFSVIVLYLLILGGVALRNKVPRFLRPSSILFFILLVIFAVLSFFFGEYRYPLLAVEALIILLLLIYTRRTAISHAKRLAEYMDSMTTGIDSASHLSLIRSPMAVAIISSRTSNVLWSNERFRLMTGAHEHTFEVNISDIVPSFSFDWLIEGKTESVSTVPIGDRTFKLYGNLVRTGSGNAEDLLATTYWVDVTDYESIRTEFYLSRPVYMIILFDNYEEILKGISERDKSALLSSIDAKIGTWTGEREGYLCKYDRDRYLYIFEERNLDDLLNDKFSVLTSVHECLGAGGVHASLSIGIGKDGRTPAEAARYAALAIEMALTRGGDQAVIKNHFNFEFFGGNSAETEKRSKVKTRVMANALGELITDSSSVFVMGHKFADFDAIGAAAGIFRIAASKNVPAYIISNPETTLSSALIDHLKQSPDYAEVFISHQDAMIRANSQSLLVVVDTSRPEETESPDFLMSMSRIAVIDHHRRAATYIDNATLSFHEPYASSTCELVTEIVQYLVDQNSVLRVEANALLMGIVLDTKTFAIHTGSRTFDAAAFLRRLGADTTEVKMLMQSDFQTAMARYALVHGAKIYHNTIAIALSPTAATRIVIAQAADELLNVAGVTASFVLSPNENGMFVSGRSIGSINVQLVLEQLGGGGNQSVAGARIESASIGEVERRLLTAIDNYLEENPFT